MNWYLAKMIFRITCGDGDHMAQFDEQLRLLKASSKEEALEKGLTLGRKEEDVFVNQQQQLVRWQFIDICELYPLAEHIDGAELYSRIEETEDPDGYLKFAHAKAERVRLGIHEL